MGKNNTAIFVANRAFALTNSRLLLMEKLVAMGWEVIAVASEDDTVPLLAKAKIKFIPIEFSRSGFNLILDVKAFKKLTQLYKENSPTLVHHFNAKPMLLGTLAAKNNVKIVNTVTGLGYAFLNNRMIRWLSSIGYRVISKKVAKVIFQNSDDQKFFVEHRLIQAHKSILILGSGVDTSKFRPRVGTLKVATEGAKIKILFASRLLWPKGVREYLLAAESITATTANIQFLIAGEFDESHPASVPASIILDAESKGFIRFLGYADMAEILPQVDLFVYPSYYGEGLARVLLEAAASGVPVVTTDWPGCREAVVDNVTGRIVSPRNAELLAKTITELVSSPLQMQEMGRRACELAREKFDIRQVANQYINVYRQI